MIKIISEIGYCSGVNNAINKLSQAGKDSKKVFLLHPLLHNIKENDFLMKNNNATYIENNNLTKESTLLFSAHGYKYKDYEYYKDKLNLVIGTCPIILSRYKLLDKEDKSLFYVFLGKKGHEESEAFISNFKFLHFIDVNSDLKKQIGDLKIKNKKVFFIPQTTLSKSKTKECVELLKENNTIVKELDICLSYYNRIVEIDKFLEKTNKDYVVFIIGDKISSNANEIYNFILNKFKSEVYITNSFDEIKKVNLKNKDIYLTSATSTSKENVLIIKKQIEDYLADLTN